MRSERRQKYKMKYEKKLLQENETEMLKKRTRNQQK